MTARLVLLISGNGSNLQALIDASVDGSLDADVVAVVSNRADAHGLVRADRAGIATDVVAREGDERATYDRRLADVVAAHRPDLVVLAGWMRVLTARFLDRFDVINLHPALPGTFAGTHAIDRAFACWEAGQTTESGVMVHWVPDEGVDNGPVIATTVVPFEKGDTLESFEARMHGAEHRLLVESVASVIRPPAGTDEVA